MSIVAAEPGRRLHTLAILGRVWVLPTVWSNCLAGWLLGGGGSPGRWLALSLGASALYLGGAFLNDAFDAASDRTRRPSRPIPAGAIPEGLVWQWGFGLLAFGTTILALLGWTTAILGLLLALFGLAYNAVHLRTPAALLLLAGCRLLLYLAGAAAAAEGITGLAVWCGLALAAYVSGIGLIARQETTGRAAPWGPVVLLGVPMVLATLANTGGYREWAFAISLLLTLWLLPFVHHLWRRPEANPAFAASGLVVGIVIVDFLAVAGGSPLLALTFAALFFLALLAQRYIPTAVSSGLEGPPPSPGRPESRIHHVP